MNIRYADSADGIDASQLRGFFVGWPTPPGPESHLRLLGGSSHVELAIAENGDVVGFATAISDGVMSAYIPFLEVLPAYQSHGIGRTLVQRLLDRLSDLYMVDLTCDPELQAFYESIGMTPSTGMMVRRREALDGLTDPS